MNEGTLLVIALATPLVMLAACLSLPYSFRNHGFGQFEPRNLVKSVGEALRQARKEWATP